MESSAAVNEALGTCWLKYVETFLPGITEDLNRVQKLS